MARPRDSNVQPCGTPAAYFRHIARGEAPCPEDRAARNRRNREWKRSRGAKPRRKPRHGTYSMYQTYRCRCEPCVAAGAEYRADRNRGILRRAQRNQPTIAELIIDVLETFGYAMTRQVLADHVTRIRPEWEHRSVVTIAMRMAQGGQLTEKEPGHWWIT